MKALSTTLLIVITAVVILVAALVLLTIFGGVMGNVGNLATFKNNCLLQCSETCKVGAMPPSWYAQVKTTDGGVTSCDKQFQQYDCSKCLSTNTQNPTGDSGRP